jgi:hypothetical protein
MLSSIVTDAITNGLIPHLISIPRPLDSFQVEVRNATGEENHSLNPTPPQPSDPESWPHGCPHFPWRAVAFWLAIQPPCHRL